LPDDQEPLLLQLTKKVFRMQTKWIFFDCFNTLLDFFDPDGDETGVKPVVHIPVESGYFKSGKEFYHRYTSWRDQHFAVNTDEVLLDARFDRVLSQSPAYPKDKDRIIENMVDTFERTFPESVRRTPGVEMMLKKYNGKVRMGVVSNFFLHGTPSHLLHQFGLSSYFEFIINSAEEGIKKPDPGIYEIALKKANIPKEEIHKVLFIGDSLENDVLGPQRLGMQAIHFDRSTLRGGHPTPEGIPSIRTWNAFEVK
jgi:putative hydrolase of the HAD superfamily